MKPDESSTTTIDTITLPNGGVVSLDHKSYSACKGCSNSYDWRTHKWTTTIYFEDTTNINTAVAYDNTNREYR